MGRGAWPPTLLERLIIDLILQCSTLTGAWRIARASGTRRISGSTAGAAPAGRTDTFAALPAQHLKVGRAWAIT